MSREDSPPNRVRKVGSRVESLLFRSITAAVVIIMFIGIAYFVQIGRLEGGALLLYAGVILGYILHASKERIR